MERRLRYSARIEFSLQRVPLEQQVSKIDVIEFENGKGRSRICVDTQEIAYFYLVLDDPVRKACLYLVSIDLLNSRSQWTISPEKTEFP